MSMPMYVDPEQITKDRADFARRGISRGLTVAAASCAEGIVLVALNASPSLKKLSEIHDRIGFAAVGKYHEFESLRVAAIRWADARAYQYSRADVSALSLANALAAAIGSAFTSGLKPLEVELLITEVGADGSDRLFRLGFDGSVADEPSPVVLGANAARIRGLLEAKDFSLLDAADTALEVSRVLLTSVPEPASLHVEAALVRRNVEGRAYESVPVPTPDSFADTATGARNGDERR